MWVFLVSTDAASSNRKRAREPVSMQRDWTSTTGRTWGLLSSLSEPRSVTKTFGNCWAKGYCLLGENTCLMNSWLWVLKQIYWCKPSYTASHFGMIWIPLFAFVDSVWKVWTNEGKAPTDWCGSMLKWTNWIVCCWGAIRSRCTSSKCWVSNKSGLANHTREKALRI